jgi:Putative transposase of IS4/5 family (DUF4096)
MRKPSPSDLTDEPWEVIEPLIPSAPVGRPRGVAIRAVLNTIFNQHRCGGPWDMLPHDLLKKRTVSDSFGRTAPGRRSLTAAAAPRGHAGVAPGRRGHGASADDETIAPEVLGHLTDEPRTRLKKV